MARIDFQSSPGFVAHSSSKRTTHGVPHGTYDPIEKILKDLNVAKRIQKLLKTKNPDMIEENGFQVSGIRNQSLFDGLGDDPTKRLLRRFDDLSRLVRENCRSLPISLSKGQFGQLKEAFPDAKATIEQSYKIQQQQREVVVYIGNTPALLRELIGDTFKK